MEKYSEVFPAKGGKRFGYRYNYASEALEFVGKFDSFRSKEDKQVYLLFIDWVVLCAASLSQQDWETSPGYWIDRYSGAAAG